MAFSDFARQRTRTPSSLSSTSSLPLSSPLYSSASRQPPMISSPRSTHPIHPALAAPHPLITFDLSLPPSLQDIGPNLLLQRATSSSKPIEIFCENFPWRILIHPRRHNGESSITVGDVLERMYACMQKTVTADEIERSRKLAGEASVGAVRAAYARRDPNGRQRMKRLDYLLGRNRFAGLNIPDDERDYQWRLHIAEGF